jgi:hypothetical protein
VLLGTGGDVAGKRRFVEDNGDSGGREAAFSGDVDERHLLRMWPQHGWQSSPGSYL